jgi:serine phosphatase RsbU (regulator of sigma subunit)
MLPNERFLKEWTGGHFILYRPRDVVSGDFYWFTRVSQPEEPLQFMIAAVDCTGHGVPGALMSMIGTNLLNQIVKENGVTSPEAVLQQLDRGVRQLLKQEENQNRDGMDAAICKVDTQTNTLYYAGAQSPLWYVQDNTLHEVKGDKTGIGGISKRNIESFTLHTIPIAQATSVYLFSDGYQHQFGGPDNRKLTPRRMRELIASLNGVPLPAQKQHFEQYLLNWMGNSSQIDDILLVGFRL